MSTLKTQTYLFLFFVDNSVVGGERIWTLVVSIGNTKKYQPIEL